jgi:hypothetical protein
MRQLFVMMSESQHLCRFFQAIQRGDGDASTSLRCAQHDEGFAFNQ